MASLKAAGAPAALVAAGLRRGAPAQRPDARRRVIRGREQLPVRLQLDLRQAQPEGPRPQHPFQLLKHGHSHF